MSKRLALVTGASRGIGRAIAHALASQGMEVVATATSESGAAAITEHFQGEGLAVTGMAMNVCDEEAVAATFAKIKEDHGKMPEVLVNNAAITRDNLLLRLKDSEWDEVLATNLTGVYKLAKTCLKPMVKARWGRIINISSVSGIMGNPGQTNYAAAKAGVIGFSKSLAKEIAGRGVTVNVVAPGFVATDMTERFQGEEREGLEKSIPVGRFAAPEEIAAAVAFLASEGASYVTGETINVNGGLHCV